MFSSRSSLLKLSPLERLVRTTSPSSTSTLHPRARKRCARRTDAVLLPAPDIPVSQIVDPGCTGGEFRGAGYGARKLPPILYHLKRRAFDRRTFYSEYVATGAHDEQTMSTSRTMPGGRADRATV